MEAPPGRGGPATRPADYRGLADRLIAAIDRMLSDQVDAILHHPDFQRLEASWRGLMFLTETAGSMRRIRIRLLDVSWRDLARDFERAIEFDQSQLFGKVYSDEFGSPGGEPFGLLIGDYYVRHQRGAGHAIDDVGTLKAIAAVAAASFCPFVTSCQPALFGLDRFADFAADVDLSRSFDGQEFARWRSLRETEDARFVGIALPRILLREPYGVDPARTDGFRYGERPAGNVDSYLWGNAAFAFASVAMRAFDHYGWFADLRGAPDDLDGGGLVSGLPAHSFRSLGPEGPLNAPLDVYLTDRQEKQLSELGIIPLSRVGYRHACVFYSTQSVHQPRSYDRGAATANARLSAMMQYVLCASRFAHYVKTIGRDRIGSFATATEFEEHLRQWLRGYCVASDDASMAVKVRYPLRDADVQVRDVAGRPGTYGCTIHLKPHFQLDEIQTSFRLVTELVGLPA
ncbi:MAG: type VI secretion system contractile sheath large subunit [Telmatospirillum sp.]|nr:type VI secretion system contractile sheath large subunit [Telmatospirillum sp.]